MKTLLSDNLRENIEMLKAAMRRPKEVATIFPTSPTLGKAVLEGHDFSKAKRVVELGPGTGAITRPLRARLSKKVEYLGVELDHGLAMKLEERFPELDFVRDSAENLPRILGRKKADIIISSIPWTLIPPDDQERMMESIITSLKPGGTFSTYVCINAAWYPAAWHLRHLLQRYFNRVEKGPVIWANMPPAFVYHCKRGLDS